MRTLPPARAVAADLEHAPACAVPEGDVALHGRATHGSERGRFLGERVWT